MGQADLFTQMEMFMMASGKTTRLMVMAFIIILMVLNTKDNGKKTSSTDKDLKFGPTTQSMRVSMKKE